MNALLQIMTGPQVMKSAHDTTGRGERNTFSLVWITELYDHVGFMLEGRGDEVSVTGLTPQWSSISLAESTCTVHRGNIKHLCPNGKWLVCNRQERPHTGLCLFTYLLKETVFKLMWSRHLGGRGKLITEFKAILANSEVPGQPGHIVRLVSINNLYKRRKSNKYLGSLHLKYETELSVH